MIRLYEDVWVSPLVMRYDVKLNYSMVADPSNRIHLLFVASHWQSAPLPVVLVLSIERPSASESVPLGFASMHFIPSEYDCFSQPFEPSIPISHIPKFWNAAELPMTGSVRSGPASSAAPT